MKNSIFEIYLAGGCKNEVNEGSEWRDSIVHDWNEEIVASSKIKIINPLQYFSYSTNRHQSEKQVKQYYFSRIKNCDCVLVNLNNSTKSCGTCQEVQYAIDCGIPVIGFGSTNVYNWLLIDCQCVFETVEEAMEYIVDYYVS